MISEVIISILVAHTYCVFLGRGKENASQKTGRGRRDSLSFRARERIRRGDVGIVGGLGEGDGVDVVWQAH